MPLQNLKTGGKSHPFYNTTHYNHAIKYDMLSQLLKDNESYSRTRLLNIIYQTMV